MATTTLPSTSTLIANEGQDLVDFQQFPGNAALWERQAPAVYREFFAEALRWPLASEFEGEPAAAVSALEDHYRRLLPTHLTSQPAFEDWIADLNYLSEIYSKMHQLAVIKLGVDTTRPCQRFHADTVTLRMVCTYLGPGTLWVTEENLDREKAERRGSHNEEFILDMSKVRQLRECDVFVMKGKLASHTPLYHKSPTMMPEDGPSLIVKFDKPHGKEMTHHHGSHKHG